MLRRNRNSLTLKKTMKHKASVILQNFYIAPSRLLDDYKHKKLAKYEIAGEYRRIYLYHIQKTAGTSLNHMFLSLGGESPANVYARLGSKNLRIRRTISNNYIYVGWDVRLIQAGYYFYAFSHTPMHALRLPPGTFTITCLRDPKKRVTSLYKEYLAYKLNNVDHPCREYSDAWLGNSFGDFLKNTPKAELTQQLYMFSERMDVEEAFDKVLSCSFIFRIENFERGCKQLSQRLNIPLAPIHMRKTTVAVDFSNSELAALDDILEPEYRLMGKLDPYTR
jgi:hypothetical protein